MVLGLTSEAYVVYKCIVPNGAPEIISINGGLLFFRSFNEAKQAALDYIALFDSEPAALPNYIWIEPISKLWINGVD